MNNLNRVIISGNLGGDPETTPVGATKFTIAVNDKWKDRETDAPAERVNWIPVVCWNGIAKSVAQYLKKGSHVIVDGSIRVTKYTAEGETENRYWTEVVASNVIFLDKKGEQKKTRPRAVK